MYRRNVQKKKSKLSVQDVMYVSVSWCLFRGVDHRRVWPWPFNLSDVNFVQNKFSFFCYFCSELCHFQGVNYIFCFLFFIIITHIHLALVSVYHPPVVTFLTLSPLPHWVLSRCSGDWTRSWLSVNISPRSTGSLATVNTCEPWMSSMTRTLESLCLSGQR